MMTEKVLIPFTVSADEQSMAEIQVLMVEFTRAYQQQKLDRPVKAQEALVVVMRSIGTELKTVTQAGLTPLGITLGLSAAALTATAIGTYRGTKRYAEQTSELFYRSKELGIEIDKIRGVVAAGEMVGMRGDAVLAGLDRFGKNADDIRRDLGTVKIELNGIGESGLVDRIKGTSDNSEALDAALKDIADHMASGQMDRVRFIVDVLFGNLGFANITMTSIAEWAAKYGRPGQRNFEVAKAYLEAVHEMERQWKLVKQRIAVAVLPGLGHALDHFRELILKNPAVMEEISKGFEHAADVTKKITAMDLVKTGRGFGVLVRSVLIPLRVVWLGMYYTARMYNMDPRNARARLSLPEFFPRDQQFAEQDDSPAALAKKLSEILPKLQGNVDALSDKAREETREKRLLNELRQEMFPPGKAGGGGAPGRATGASFNERFNAVYGTRHAGYGSPGGFRGTPAGPQEVQPDVEGGRTISGAASWYQPGVGWAGGGGQTASGEMYDPNAYTAAIQMGYRDAAGGVRYGKNYQEQWADVTDPATGKTLRVKINDVMPYNKGGRVIDLNRASAEYFGAVNRGVVPNVTVRLLPPAPPGTYSGGPVETSVASPIKPVIAPGVGGLPQPDVTPSDRINEAFNALDPSERSMPRHRINEAFNALRPQTSIFQPDYSLLDEFSQQPKVNVKVKVAGPGLAVNTEASGDVINKVTTQREKERPQDNRRIEPVPYLDYSRDRKPMIVANEENR